MTRLLSVVVSTLALGCLLGASCDLRPAPPVPPPVTGGTVGSGGTGSGGQTPVAGAAGVPSDGGLMACVAAATASPGVRNVAETSGRSLVDAVNQICSSPALRACYAEGRCK